MPYRLPHMRYEGYRIYTNKPPCGAVRGQSLAIARFTFESLVNIVAEEMGLDQAEIRSKNALITGDLTTTEVKIVDEFGFKECLQKVADGINWEERKKKKIPNRGIGFAGGSSPSGARMGGHFGSAAVVKVAEDGTVDLIHGGTEMGQGCDTVMAQIAAEVLGTRFEDVRIAVEDSDTTIFDSGMFSDRCTYWTGNAVKAAAEDAKRQLIEIIAPMLEAKAEDIEFIGGMIHHLSSSIYDFIF